MCTEYLRNVWEVQFTLGTVSVCAFGSFKSINSFKWGAVSDHSKIAFKHIVVLDLIMYRWRYVEWWIACKADSFVLFDSSYRQLWDSWRKWLSSGMEQVISKLFLSISFIEWFVIWTCSRFCQFSIYQPWILI